MPTLIIATISSSFHHMARRNFAGRKFMHTMRRPSQWIISVKAQPPKRHGGLYLFSTLFHLLTADNSAFVYK